MGYAGAATSLAGNRNARFVRSAILPARCAKSSALVVSKGRARHQLGRGFSGPFAAEHAPASRLAALLNLTAWRPSAQPLSGREAERLGTRRSSAVGVDCMASATSRGPPAPASPFCVRSPRLLRRSSRRADPSRGSGAVAARSRICSDKAKFLRMRGAHGGDAGSVNAALLARPPQRAVFVNVGRGRVVDESALVLEASSGRIQVAVDVTAEE